MDLVEQLKHYATEYKDVAQVVGVLFALVALGFTAYSTRRTAQANRARYWLDLRKLFNEYEEIHQNLRPGGKWNPGRPQSVQELVRLETYMGLFEHCEAMLQQKQIDEWVFDHIYSYRLKNIVANEWIYKEKLVPYADSWEFFWALLERMNVPQPWKESVAPPAGPGASAAHLPAE